MKNALLEKFLNLFLSDDQCTPSHSVYKFLGIKFVCLKPAISKERKNFSQYYNSFKNPTEIPKAEGAIRLIQKADAAFLASFDEFCKENNFSYWLDFGTLLGAVRHKGFIPWDDDIDISMLRPDYERLISLFKENKYQIGSFNLYFENNRRNRCFAKIKHCSSDNLFIDIFPYDFYPDKLSQKEKDELSLRIKKCQKSVLIKKFDTEQIRKKFKNLTQKKILKNKELKNNNTIFMGLDYPHKWQHKVYDYETIFPLKRIKYEGYALLAPNYEIQVLESIYGDFMQLPKDCYPRHANYIEIDNQEQRLLNELAERTKDE